MGILPAAEVDRIFTRLIGSRLQPHGFEAVSPRKWVRSTRAPIRDVLWVMAMKGNSYSLYWGVSLDYVPHVSGSTVRWHRTARSAMYDLRYDPIDYTTEARSCMVDVFQSAIMFGAALLRLADRMLPLARAFWEPLTSVEALLAAFEEKRNRPFVRFGFQNYPQEQLAYAFVLARAGRREDGRERLLAMDRSGALPKGCIDELIDRLENVGND